MKSRSELKRKKKFKLLTWISITILLIIAITGNNYFQQYAFYLNISIITIISILSSIMILKTKKGKKILDIFLKSRIEMQKIIWPSQKETLQITILVIIFTFFATLGFWGLDSILIYLMTFITNLRF